MCEQRVVLVVDDNLLVRSMVEATLGLRYRVLSASTADEALERCAHEVPSLVLLDVHLEGESGIAVCDRLRGALQPTPPIVFLTGDVDPALAARCREVGGVDLLHKPFSPLELLERIGALLGSNSGA
ncbi:MAG: response regulator [Planctomycetes bacterium]|nr:response regulator [Planctomycetota bacterium]